MTFNDKWRCSQRYLAHGAAPNGMANPALLASYAERSAEHHGHLSAGWALEVSDMENRLEVQLAAWVAFLEIVDKNRCSDPRGSDFSNKSLKCQELATSVN